MLFKVILKTNFISFNGERHERFPSTIVFMKDSTYGSLFYFVFTIDEARGYY